MDTRPIGVFDSGLGGLTAVRVLRRILPEENLIYFGDTARVPYGGRSRETLLKYARQDLRFLRSFDLKAVLIACGTISTTSLDVLQAENELPIVGVVEPTCRRALAVTKNRRVGMIATLASVRSGAYEAALRRLDPEVEVLCRPCPLFVPLVENGFVEPEEEVTRLVAERYLAPLREAGVDTLILGCTHYPLIRETIQRAMGLGVALVDSGREAALALAGYLETQEMLCGAEQPRRAEYYVSDAPENFGAVAQLFLGHAVEGKQVDLEAGA